ncbi:MAG: peroxiredoxin [Prevotellaceae bacterium]|jgi:peroxiredoxin (alkyl hydroperoxide reductase subunit C)|nr:peroxiredoxin [Prevotellaceae bacterium]
MAVLVGRKAPIFKTKAVVDGGKIVENYSLEQFIDKKYVVLFFYPADFTFVCPTEILAFQEKLSEFEARNTVVIGASTDSENAHWKWLQTPRKEGGINGVKYPLLVDQNMQISKAYDVLAGCEEYDENGDETFTGVPQAYRGLFLIDKKGIVRHQVVNDMPIGRSVNEILRVIDALQYTEAYGEVCPANWNKGEKAMKPTHEGVADYLSH